MLSVSEIYKGAVFACRSLRWKNVIVIIIYLHQLSNVVLEVDILDQTQH